MHLQWAITRDVNDVSIVPDSGQVEPLVVVQCDGQYLGNTELNHSAIKIQYAPKTLWTPSLSTGKLDGIQ